MPAIVSSDPFQALAADLRASGDTVYSSRLEGILNGVWTTSSELVGELGQVVLSIRKECRPLTRQQRTLIKECLRQVRKVWPGFGLFSIFRSW